MADRSLGYFTITPGIRQRATAYQLDPDAQVGASSYKVQVHPDNKANIYVGGSALDAAAGTDVYFVIPATQALPVISDGSQGGRVSNIYDMASIYVDADAIGTPAKCIISFTES